MKGKKKKLVKAGRIVAALLLTLSVCCGCAQPLIGVRQATTAPPVTEEVTGPLETVPVTEPAQPQTTPVESDPPIEPEPEVPETTLPAETVELTGGGQILVGEPNPGSVPVIQQPTETVDSNWSPEMPYYPSVLMYHLILEDPYTDLTGLFVRPSEFADHLEKMSQAGCQFLFADEYACTSEKSVILTFDDGYEDNYTEMFPILKQYGAKATIFMIAYKIDTPGYLTSDMIREMSASGLVHFGSHTSSHPDLRYQSAEQLADEFGGSSAIISALTGRQTTAICYPGGYYNNFVLEQASHWFQFGYTTVNSADTSGCDPMALCRVRVSRGMSGNAVLSLLGW